MKQLFILSTCAICIFANSAFAQSVIINNPEELLQWQIKEKQKEIAENQAELVRLQAELRKRQENGAAKKYKETIAKYVAPYQSNPKATLQVSLPDSKEKVIFSVYMEDLSDANRKKIANIVNTDTGVNKWNEVVRSKLSLDKSNGRVLMNSCIDQKTKKSTCPGHLSAIELNLGISSKAVLYPIFSGGNPNLPTWDIFKGSLEEFLKTQEKERGE